VQAVFALFITAEIGDAPWDVLRNMKRGRVCLLIAEIFYFGYDLLLFCFNYYFLFLLFVLLPMGASRLAP